MGVSEEEEVEGSSGGSVGGSVTGSGSADTVIVYFVLE